MKSDIIQYEQTYLRLKSKIENGILPVGARLPGRSILCRELGTSEKTIRHALELPEQDGFLEITPRKRPTVISSFAAPEGNPIRFAKTAAEMFEHIRKLITQECKRLGYWDAAMQVYDGEALRK